MRILSKILTLFFLLILLIPSQAQAAITPIDLGTLGGNNGFASDINDNGQIVGTSSTTTPGVDHAFLLADGEFTDLGVLEDGIRSNANKINNNGQVVGRSTINADTSNLIHHAFIWDSGVMTDLGTIRDGWESFASDINDNAQVVGWDGKGGPEGDFMDRGFIWKDGDLTDIGVLEGNSSSLAKAINKQGKVVGWSMPYGGSEQGFIWENNVFTLLDEEFIPIDINDVGEILSGNSIYKDGIYISLNGLSAFAFNNNRQVVGVKWNGTEFHAHVWDSGVLTDLGTLGGNQSHAFGINDYGQIVGRSTDTLGRTRPVLWNLPPVADVKVNGSNGPVEINYNSTITLSWTARNVKTCALSPLGLTGISGEEQIDNVVASETYTLSCTGPGGNVNDSVTVNVSQPSPTPTSTPTPTITPSPTPSLPVNKEECKKDGWSQFLNLFRNQGDCIKSVVRSN